MARKIQLGAFVLGMLLVGVERFTAAAATARDEVRVPVHGAGTPIPPPE